MKVIAAANIVLLIACAVSGNPIGPVKETKDLDGSLVLQKRARSQRCEYDGETYEKGALLNITKNGACDLRKCIRGKFRKVEKLYNCDEPCELGWLPGCCLCKKKSCENNRNVGDTWSRVKSMTGPNKGICSRCYCAADHNEYCQDNKFTCFVPAGCQETEAKPEPDTCCPKCKMWKKSTTTTQPWVTIPITLPIGESTTEPFPFTFPPGFDSSENEDR